MIAVAELVADGVLEVLLRLELLLELLQLELAEGMHEALMKVVLRHILAMGCPFELHPSMLERRQRLVPFVHKPH